MIREYIIKISDEIMEEEIADRPQELVRCKDCEFHHASEKLNLCWCENDFIEGLHSREWFCADGNRKEGR